MMKDTPAATPVPRSLSCEWLYPGLADPIPDPSAIVRGSKHYVDPADWTWVRRFDVGKAYAAALQHLATCEIPKPIKCEGDGLIVCGGDTAREPYGFMASLSIRMARRHGYQGPVEWWHDPRAERIEPKYLRGLENVRVRSFADLAIDHRNLGTWWKKILAWIYSDFRFVVAVDADLVLAEDANRLLAIAKRIPFLGWRNTYDFCRPWCVLNLGGDQGIPSLNSGLLIFDRLASWRGLLMAHFIGQHGAVYFDANLDHPQKKDWAYGDESAVRIAWAALKKWGKPAGFAAAGTCGYHEWQGTDGRKVALTCSLDGKPIAQHKILGKARPAGWAVNHGLPGESDLLAEAARVRHELPAGWTFRPGWCDVYNFDGVNLHNEYRLPEKLGADDVVVDVGGHIGSFAWAAYERGAKRIFCAEPHPENYAILASNVGEFALCHNIAVWAGPIHTDARLTPWGADGNTAAAQLAIEGDGPKVDVRDFDEWLGEIYPDGEIAILKLDCEGAELKILMLSKNLHRIRRIVAEIHAPGMRGEVAQQLTNRLESMGFAVEIVLTLPEHGQGHLFAIRKGANS